MVSGKGNPRIKPTFGSLLARLLHPVVIWLHNLLSASNVHSQSHGLPDVVIILGYALYKDGSCSAPLQTRVEAGVRAWERLAGQRPHTALIFSGAHPGDGLRRHSEANAMLTHAMVVKQHENGSKQPHVQWLLEQRSISTRENAMFSLQIVKEHGWHNILVVTNQFHQRRSLLTFKKAACDLHMKVQVLVEQLPFAGHQHGAWGGGPLLDMYMDMYDGARELAALPYYWAKGYL